MHMFRLILSTAALAVAALTLTALPLASVRADVPKIVLDQGTPKPMPIAIPEFFATSPQNAQIARDIARVVSADLESSGLFAPIDPNAFIQKSGNLMDAPRFQDWKLINAQALVGGTISPSGSGYLISYRLWDVFGEQDMGGFQLNTRTPDAWRRAAHQIADKIYQRFTGEEGYFDTRVVYVSETGPKLKRVKRLALMDQDGENHKMLTDGGSLVLTPRFSPVTQDITYMSYYGNKPRVYLFNILSGQQEVLGDFPGMTFAPRFSPDGAKVIMSMAQGGNTDIYTMDIQTRRTQRITNTPGIDTAPSYAPNGSQITFESDRGGSQQIYVMGADGSGPRRISKNPGRYGTPVWSPRGDLIAFTRQYQGSFYIGVMRPDGSGERMLSQGWLIEGPTWAPNGRVLAYFKQEPSGKTQLHSIDLTGNNERVMKTPLDGSDPAWSPLLGNQ